MDDGGLESGCQFLKDCRQMKRALLMPLLFCAISLGVSAQDTSVDWVQVTSKAQWQPRDSSGEVVFRDRLWLFGGWFTSFVGTPRDVWSSANGRTWTRVTEQAAWKHGDLPMSLVFDDKMWFMGGWLQINGTEQCAHNRARFK